jgi:hypothetical protein
MVYLQDMATQTRLFLFFLALGFLLGLVYDAVRALRVLFLSPRRPTLVLDAVFGGVAAAVSFLALLALNDGDVQYFSLLGEGLGALVYAFSLGQAGVRWRVQIFRTKNKLVQALLRPMRWFVRKIRAFGQRIGGAIHKLSEKQQQKRQKRLQSATEMQYNINHPDPLAPGGRKGKGHLRRGKQKKAPKETAKAQPDSHLPAVPRVRRRGGTHSVAVGRRQSGKGANRRHARKSPSAPVEQ